MQVDLAIFLRPLPGTNTDSEEATDLNNEQSLSIMSITRSISACRTVKHNSSITISEQRKCECKKFSTTEDNISLQANVEETTTMKSAHSHSPQYSDELKPAVEEICPVYVSQLWLYESILEKSLPIWYYLGVDKIMSSNEITSSPVASSPVQTPRATLEDQTSQPSKPNASMGVSGSEPIDLDSGPDELNKENLKSSVWAHFERKKKMVET
ncbi:hypothetical protein RJ639_045904 [Escallonia herrerae]|uniref:Uncharacterized protein n=1 Tax=Escallonia herrerae TaxID=1293975 RepID=A0AA88W4S5_9ASTE|nr:hypothetical protein RJ639_045904 [Escallonia herrerae]